MKYDDIKVGDFARMFRDVTQEDIDMFAKASLDTNPAHIDPEYAAGTKFGRTIAHGMLSAGLISAAIGTKLPGTGTIYLSQTLEFTSPVYPGDILVALVRVVEKLPKGRLRLATTVLNQVGDTVLRGEALVIAPRE